MNLNPEKIKIIELKLLEEKKEIEAQLQNLDQNVDFGSDIDHGEEEADETEEIVNRQGIKKALENRLENINFALDKLKRGEYGKCEKCGAEIDFELLEAAPESKLCRECKARE